MTSWTIDLISFDQKFPIEIISVHDTISILHHSCSRIARSRQNPNNLWNFINLIIPFVNITFIFHLKLTRVDEKQISTWIHDRISVIISIQNPIWSCSSEWYWWENYTEFPFIWCTRWRSSSFDCRWFVSSVLQN